MRADRHPVWFLILIVQISHKVRIPTRFCCKVLAVVQYTENFWNLEERHIRAWWYVAYITCVIFQVDWYTARDAQSFKTLTDIIFIFFVSCTAVQLNSRITANKIQRVLIYLYLQTLYKFQAVPPPIIRSTQLYIQLQVLSNNTAVSC